MTKEELLSEVRSTLIKATLNHRTYGKGVIETVEDISEGIADLHDIIITASFLGLGGATKCLSLKTLYNLGICVFIEYSNEQYFLKTFQEKYSAISDAEYNSYIEQYKQEKVAAEQKAKEARYEKRVTKAIQKLESLEKTNIKVSYDNVDEFYMALGWMTKHCGTVSAAMPDYAEKWFISKFGDVKRQVVNSKKRTVNGNPMQWALSMKITFKKVTDIPAYLADKINSKNEINSVGFVWDLVDTYGFKFGSVQDEQQIKNGIPVDKLTSFELGYNL